MSRHSLRSGLYRRLAPLIISAHGGICGLCGHGGADSIDHRIPISWGLVDPYDVRFWRPAHYRPCPETTCQRRCNTESGDRGQLPADLNTSRRW